MPALQVRDFPAELYEELREYAELNHRSIAQQTIACVERELAQYRRSKEFDNDIRLSEEIDPEDIAIPQNVREASSRARSVEPFKWMHAFEIESDADLKARKEKWRKLNNTVAALNEYWKDPEQTPEEIAAMIREERDNRTDAIIGGAERRDSSSQKRRSA